MTAHRAPSPTDLPCPVCRAQTGATCRGVDYLPLPFVHGERTATTPIYAAIIARAEMVARDGEWLWLGGGAS